MKIYIASASLGQIRDKLENLRILESYFYIKGRREIVKKPPVVDWFLDSGAFSAWSKKKTISVEAYGDFIKRHREHFDCYANLDDISDPRKTQSNQEYLESQGLKPIPVYHYGEPDEILENLVEHYDYIALGGMVPISTGPLMIWLDDKFDIICNSDGTPKVKVHGFGMTTLFLMERYPWYSIDSTSPILGAAMGRVYSDHREIDLSDKAGPINLATREYFKQYHPEYDVDELKRDYRLRTVHNIKHMQKLEQRLTLNPPCWVRKQLKLFV